MPSLAFIFTGTRTLKETNMRQLTWQMEEKWIIPKVNGVAQTRTEERAWPSYFFIICNEAEKILDLQITVLTLDLPDKKIN